MYKTENLLKLQTQGLNVHTFKLCWCLEDVRAFRAKNPRFSVRFDSDGYREDLPFFTVTPESTDDELNKMCKMADFMCCGMLCANGLAADDYLVCNFVYKLTHNWDLILEFSTVNVPLRKMYNYKTSVVTGSFWTCDTDPEFVKLGSTSKNRLLDCIITTGIMDRYIECSLYTAPVGMLGKYTVCWQVRGR